MKKKAMIITIIALIGVLLIGYFVLRYTNVVDIKKQQMELDIQEETLDMEYRSGKISAEEYQQRKMDIELKEEKLDLQEDVWQLDF